MARLNLSVPDSVRRFVDERVKAGGYDDAGAYVRALIEADRERADELAELRGAIRQGLNDFEAGHYTTYDAPEKLAAEVKARGRARLAQTARRNKGNGR